MVDTIDLEDDIDNNLMTSLKQGNKARLTSAASNPNLHLHEFSLNQTNQVKRDEESKHSKEYLAKLNKKYKATESTAKQ